MIIRQFEKQDVKLTKEIVKSAFYRSGKDSVFNEWEFIDRVRNDSGFVEELCMIATIDKKVVGYIILTQAYIGSHEGLTLGPLAVMPANQRTGIGKHLVNKGIEKARELGYEWIALTGGDYYSQFGFEPALKNNIILDDNHPENEYLMICYLNMNIKEVVNGKLKFADSFYDDSGELL